METLFPKFLLLFLIYICEMILLLTLADFRNSYLPVMIPAKDHFAYAPMES